MDDVQNVGIVLAVVVAAASLLVTVEFGSVAAFCCSCVASNRKIESSSVAEFESADCGVGLARLAFCCCSLSDDLLRCMERNDFLYKEKKPDRFSNCTQLTWQRGFFVS